MACSALGGYYTYYFDQSVNRQFDEDLLHFADQRHLKRGLNVSGLGSNWTPGSLPELHERNGNKPF